MRELSLHILDVVQNSLAAGATTIEITVAELIRANRLQITIADNGRGMAAEELRRVLDPFYTSRRTRKVGLGLPLFQAAAQRSGGDFRIVSQPGEGTNVSAVFQYDHLDRAPLGNLTETLVTLIVCNPGVRFLYRHSLNDRTFDFDSEDARSLPCGAPVALPQTVERLKSYIKQGIDGLSMN